MSPPHLSCGGGITTCLLIRVYYNYTTHTNTQLAYYVFTINYTHMYHTVNIVDYSVHVPTHYRLNKQCVCCYNIESTTRIANHQLIAT